MPLTSKALKVYIQHPEFGKGWYVVPNVNNPAMDDEAIVAKIRREQPDATAIRIVRDTPLR